MSLFPCFLYERVLLVDSCKGIVTNDALIRKINNKGIADSAASGY